MDLSNILMNKMFKKVGFVIQVEYMVIILNEYSNL